MLNPVIRKQDRTYGSYLHFAFLFFANSVKARNDTAAGKQFFKDSAAARKLFQQKFSFSALCDPEIRSACFPLLATGC